MKLFLIIVNCPPDQHIYHRDLDFAEHNRDVITRGRFANLAIGGRVIEIDTTDVHGYDYSGLLERVRSALTNTMGE